MGKVVFSFDEFEVDPARSELRRAGHPLKVDALVLDLLAYLVSRAGELVTHDELIENVWQGRAVSDNVVSVSMAKLRKVLGHRRGDREFVLNVYGRGYRFVRTVRTRDRRSDPPGPLASPLREGRPFVGREAVMARLCAALESARLRQGRACALLGEPGIGKTRVAEALEQHALASGARVAWGRCRELDGAPPFWPWVEVVRELLAAVTPARAEAQLGKSFAELSRVLPELGSAPFLQSDDAGARFRTFDAVARLCALAGQDAPWVLTFDDLHRGDAASLELLSYLVEGIARLPIVIVATLRKTERPASAIERRHLEHVLGHRNCERFELARLSQGDVSAYTAAVLGHGDEALARAVFVKSEGNAFFMTELLRDIAQTEERGGWAGREPSLPAAALDLVKQRVRRVGEDAHRILTAAAVIGRSFDLSLLSTVTDIPAAALLEALDDALASEVIVAAPEGLARFAFGHDLIRAVLYDGLPSLERAALHLRVAEALADCERRGLQVAPIEQAHHLLSALPHGDVIRAVERAERAADAAMMVAAHADAAGILRRALAALDLSREAAPALRCRLHYRISICLRSSDGPESIAHLRKSVALARAHGLHRMLVWAGQAMVRSPGVIMVGEGRAVLEDALAGLPEDDHELRAMVLSYLCWCAPYCMDVRQAEDLTKRALEHARASGSDAALLAALRTQIHIGGGPCRPVAETRALLAEADRVAAGQPAPLRALWAHQSGVFRAIFALQRGDRPGLDRALRQLDQAASEMRHGELTWHCDRMRVIDRMNRGELREVEPLLRELRERGERLQLFAYQQVCANDRLVWLRQTTDISKVSDTLATPGPVLVEDPPAIRAIKLRVASELRRKDIVRVILAEFAATGFDVLPRDRDYLGILSNLAIAAFAQGLSEYTGELERLLLPHADFYSADVSLHSDGSIAHVLGLLARARGRRSAAIERFEHAIAQNDAFELPVRAAESRFELAATLIEGSAAERGRARELLDAVAVTARALGLRPLLARVQACTRAA